MSGVNETDTDGSNDIDTAAFDVQAIDVAVSNTVDVPIANEGDTVTFTTQATNTGPDAETGLTISDPLPGGFTVLSTTVTAGSYSAGIWTVDPLAVSGTEILTITGTIDPGTAGSTISNTVAFASTDQTDTNATNNSASASVSVNAVDIAVTKTVNSGSPPSKATS